MDFAGIVTVLSFRAVPFVLHALFSRNVAVSSRVLWVLSFSLALVVANAAGASLDTVLIGAPLALGYFAGVGVLVHRWSLTHARRLSGALLLVLLCGICLVLPAVALPPTLALPTLILGWEVMLSAHGYLRDIASSRKSPPETGELLFFLLVNPTLAYAERGRAIGSPDVIGGTSRCFAGVAAWIGQDAVVALMQPKATSNPLSELATLAGYPRFLALYSTLFLAYYLGQSGLASFRIGLMALSGYGVPECFRYPFLAQSPQDFWQRWNIWVGTWARRYVFFPTSLALHRRYRGMPHAFGIVVTMLLTFVVIGLLHDALKWCARLPEHSVDWPAPKGFVFFALSGVVLLLWAGCGRLLERFVPSIVLQKTWLSSVVRMVLALQVIWFTHAATLRLLPGSSVQPGGW